MTVKSAMAATYTLITLEEFKTYLNRAFRILRPRQGLSKGEICFDLTLGKFVGIRVLTSIRSGFGLGAQVGKDMIRVGLISLKDHGPLERKKFAGLKRTQGWRDNLKKVIEQLVEKYEDNDEFWEQWAETRKRQDQTPRPSSKSPRIEEIEPEAVDGEIERPVIKPPVPTRQYDPNRMQDGITDKQMSYLRVLMRGMTPQRWHSSGASDITGMDTPPTRPSEVRGLSKGQASRLIDALKSSGAMGGARYALELAAIEAEMDPAELGAVSRYDWRV